MNPENEKSKGRYQTYLVWGWLAACKHRDFKVSKTSCKEKIIKNAGDRIAKKKIATQNPVRNTRSSNKVCRCVSKCINTIPPVRNTIVIDVPARAKLVGTSPTYHLIKNFSFTNLINEKRIVCHC
jgi:hypothetical protein